MEDPISPNLYKSLKTNQETSLVSDRFCFHLFIQSQIFKKQKKCGKDPTQDLRDPFSFSVDPLLFTEASSEIATVLNCIENQSSLCTEEIREAANIQKRYLNVLHESWRTIPEDY